MCSERSSTLPQYHVNHYPIRGAHHPLYIANHFIFSIHVVFQDRLPLSSSAEYERMPLLLLLK